MIESYPMSAAPIEAFGYFVVMGFFHLAVMIAVLLLAVPLLFVSRRMYFVYTRGFCVFNVLLLVLSSILNGVWSCAIWGNIYFSTDYVIDFTPFWPITQNLIDMSFGDVSGDIFYGLSILHVQAIWLGFAFAAWAGTVFLYSKTRRLWNMKNIEQKNAV
jgi:hypothetical protein